MKTIKHEKTARLLGAFLVITLAPILPAMQIEPLDVDYILTLPVTTQQLFEIDGATISEGLSAFCYSLDEFRSTESELGLETLIKPSS
jgi:hypothetical protein